MNSSVDAKPEHRSEARLNLEFPQDGIQAADLVTFADLSHLIEVCLGITCQQFQDIGFGLEPARIELQRHKLG